jgi:hypothetical protein
MGNWNFKQDIEECILFLSGEIHFWPNDQIEVSVQPYDMQMLTSLGRQLAQQLAFTEKQSVIGLRLVQKYSSLLKKYEFEVDKIINEKVFRWPFRTIDRTKSLYIDGESIVIKSPFIANIVNTIKKRKSKGYLQGTYHADTKEWSFDYNEPNVEFLINLTNGMHFNIDEKIKQDYEKIKAVKQQAEKHLPMLRKENGRYIFKDKEINEDNIRTVFHVAKSMGCEVYDDKLVNENQFSGQIDKILYSDQRNHFVNKYRFKKYDLAEFLLSARKVLIMVSSRDEESMKEWITTLNEYTDLDDICVCFRYKNDNQANKFIKEQNVNQYSTDKKVFIVSEKIPKPIIKDNINFDVVLIDLATMPSHYKTQTFIKNKPTIVYYCGSKPTGVDNIVDV